LLRRSVHRRSWAVVDSERKPVCEYLVVVGRHTEVVHAIDDERLEADNEAGQNRKP
jgi:hypothetical protein